MVIKYKTHSCSYKYYFGILDEFINHKSGFYSCLVFKQNRAFFLEELGGIEPRSLLAGFASQIALLCAFQSF